MDKVQIRTKQARTELVTNRLGRLDAELKELHQQAIKACLSASDEVQSPVEAAAIVRELLDKFKGELIRRSREGRKATFERIAENLGFESLKAMIADQQEIYDDLHNELSGILKSRISPAPSRVQELLSLAEDIILTVTIVTDPKKIGFEFYS